MQQVTTQAVAALPQWKVKVQKCKAVQTVLNLCSPSVTDKCLIAEAWCPTAKLPELQSALREGGVRLRETAVMAYTDHYYIKSFFLFLYYLFSLQRKSGSGVDSFYNRLPSSTPPPTLFPLNSFTTGFQNIVDAYGVANYREVNPGMPKRYIYTSLSTLYCLLPKMAHLVYVVCICSGVYHYHISLLVCRHVWGCWARFTNGSRCAVDGA